MKVKAVASFVTAAARTEIIRAEGNMVLYLYVSFHFVEAMATIPHNKEGIVCGFVGSDLSW